MSPPNPTDAGRICPEEEESQSAVAGVAPVSDGEHLARVVLRPLHLEGGELARGFLNLGQLENGWSFIRREIAGDEKIKAHGKTQAGKKPGQEMHGFAVVKAADFRAILDDENRQAFCILDDERDDAPAHAIAKNSVRRAKNKQRKLRKRVLDLLALGLTVL